MKICKLFISLSLLFGISLSVKSQEAVTDLLNGNIRDANTLTKAYLEPLGYGFGNSLNNGWYNTAKPHKFGGFDITFNAAISMPPSSSKTFKVPTNLEYWQAPANSVAPTVAGAKEDGPVLQARNVPGATLTLPQGAELKFIPAPAIQIGIGLPFNTEIIGRIIPKIDVGDVGKFSLWGIGVKNEFKEFIPGFKALPFNVSALIGYTNFKSSFAIDEPSIKPANSTKVQELVFNAKAYTVRLLVSKSIPVLTIYAGVGYNRSKTSVDLKGDYIVTNSSNVTDPIALDFKNNGMNANIGLRIKLAIIALHFDYSVGKYKAYNVGVGINFR